MGDVMQDRLPAVAGMFYPGDPAELADAVAHYLQPPCKTDIIPKAMIVPHAGYIYSGPIAGSAYTCLRPLRDQISRVILLGPSHRVPVIGLATSNAKHFITPLGAIELDQDCIKEIQQYPQVHSMDEAHALEHSLEVQLPFLQTVLGSFKLVPIVVGDASAKDVSTILDKLWGSEETLIVISSDLSHYHDYETARQMDARTSHAIETMDTTAIQYDDACGRNPVNGLLQLACQRNMHVVTIDCRNSGDTAGSKDQVVGYGAYLFYS